MVALPVVVQMAFALIGGALTDRLGGTRISNVSFAAMIASTLVFVFSDSAGGLWAFLRYNLVYWVTFALNLGVLPLVVETTHVDPRIAQAGFIACAAVGSYAAHKAFSFARPHR